MQHNFTINCLIGDILNYYTTMRLSNVYKIEKDPTELIIDIDIDDIRERTSNIVITDGIINEFDYAKLNIDGNEKTISFKKKIKVCKARYAIHIAYTKAANVYTGVRTYIYMPDMSKLDTIYGDIPHDIYFW